jgi:hypothetical protein
MFDRNSLGAVDFRGAHLSSQLALLITHVSARSADWRDVYIGLAWGPTVISRRPCRTRCIGTVRAGLLPAAPIVTAT